MRRVCYRDTAWRFVFLFRPVRNFKFAGQENFTIALSSRCYERCLKTKKNKKKKRKQKKKKRKKGKQNFFHLSRDNFVLYRTCRASNEWN